MIKSAELVRVLLLLSSMSLDAFFFPVTGFYKRGVRCQNSVQNASFLISNKEVHVGDLLSDIPTPSLLLELSLAEGAVEKGNSKFQLDPVLENADTLTAVDNSIAFNGTLFVHTKVIDTSERDKITNEQGSGKSIVICQVDVSPDEIPGGAYLGIGLANHHVGGYYWARGMGMGAGLPAHGIAFRHRTNPNSSADSSSSSSSAESSGATGELYWRKRGPGRDARETTEESSNSNDGKRSEWADFVQVGDTVQLVPEDPIAVLWYSPFRVLLGVRRIGRPLGADPIVEKIWILSETGEGWVPK